MSTAATNKMVPLLDLLDDERLRALGTLTVERAAKRVSLPLQKVDIQARVVDRVAQVTLTEVFKNPYTDHLEAVYIFPLPGGSAVSDFEMRVGDRVIKGVVKERGQARVEYQQALTEGKRAALLEQERDDVFTMQVGNIPPQEEITVVLTYSERLPFFENGTTEMRLPLVVAPRYIAGQALDREPVGFGTSPDTDKVPDASRITPPLLCEGFDPKVALTISVELSLAGLAKKRGGAQEAQDVEDLCCSQHAIRTGLSADAIKISLSRENEPLNRDFVLRWRLSEKSVRPAVVFHRFVKPAKGKKNISKEERMAAPCYAMLSVVPPQREGFLGMPRDVVFVLDRSGSMGGIKMTSAARACSLLLSSLGPTDRYAILAFDTVNEWMPGKEDQYFRYADETGLDHGEKFLRTIDARGGTEIHPAMKAALESLHHRKLTDGRVPVVVVLTDGQIGDESSVLKEVQKELKDARVFTVGIDTAVNEGFLKRVAVLGGGTCTFVQPGEQLETALRNVAREIGQPLITDVEIEDISCGLDKASLSPSSIPDLFAGRATSCYFSFTGGKEKGMKVRIKGRYADGSKYSEEVEAVEVDLPALSQLWAKAHITDLEDAFRSGVPGGLKDNIVSIAVQHSILTRFTAFVVVDEAEIVNKTGDLRTMVQPVEQPAQWQKQMITGPAAASASGWGAPSGLSFGAAPSFQHDALDSFEAGAAPPPRPAGRFSPFRNLNLPAAPQGQPPASPSVGGPPPAESIKRKMLAREISPQQPQGPSAAGSYGSSARAQVFEVIVRQAIAGQDWREFCKGPMQVNNITPEEVEEEVARRTGIAPNPPRRGDDSSTGVETALKKFFERSEKIWTDLEAGTMPGADEFEKAREDLMNALSQSALAVHMPLMQRLLRTDAVELVAALRSQKASVAELLKKAHSYRDALQSAKAEVESALKGILPQDRFWESTI